MDIKINFIQFDENVFKIKLPETPEKIFIDFDSINTISQNDFKTLINIYDKFVKSNLFFINVSKDLEKQLRFLLERNKKIRIIPNEVKENTRTSNE